jgi:formate dehydrogenase maturation protein FdhE
MAKKGKLSTPEWILEGYDSKDAYDKSKGVGKKKKAGKKYKIRKCPECGSEDVGVVLTGEEGRGAKEWECRKCKWHGVDIDEQELTEDEFIKYLDKKGEGEK